MEDLDHKIGALACKFLEPTFQAISYLADIHDLLAVVVMLSVVAIFGWLLPPLLSAVLLFMFFVGPFVIFMSFMVVAYWEAQQLQRDQ